jgi:hypothetical protein
MVGRAPAEAVDPAGPVEERIFRVNVKVYETVQSGVLGVWWFGGSGAGSEQAKVMGVQPHPELV